MSKRSLALRVGGAAGDGVSSTAESFAKISARSGLHTWTYSSYQSVIRGGHVWTQVRGGLDPLLSHGDDPDVVLCLNQQTMDVHQADVPEGGAIIYDVDSVKPDPTKIRKNVRLIGIPLRKKAQTLSPNALMRNTVALGAAVQLFDMDFRHVESAFKDIWGDKKPEVAQQNLQAAKLGASAVVEMGGSLHLGLAYTNEAKYLMTGNEALCLGALAAGVKFLAQYPMTPASSILHWMALHGPKYGVVVKQVEDELSAMNMAVGAGFAGGRSIAATSGGGFRLLGRGNGSGWNDGRGRRDREGLSPIPDHGERREPAGVARDEGIPVHRGDGRTYGERGADLRHSLGPSGIRRGAAEDAREADAQARRPAEGHAASGDLGSEERGPDRDPMGFHLGRGARGDPPSGREGSKGKQPGVPDDLPVPCR